MERTNATGHSHRFTPLVLVAAILAASCADDPQRRIARISSWKREGSQESLLRVRELLADADAGVRAAAVDALVSRDAPGAVEGAIAALADPDGSVRATAVRGLGELRSTAAVPQLVRLLTEDPEARVRQRAAEALEILGGDEVGAALAAALDDPSRLVRLAAGRACGRLESSECVESLARVILDDPDWSVRVVAAHGLGRSGRSEAMGALEAATGDPNEFVRAAAASALAAIAKPAPTSPPGDKEAKPSPPPPSAGGEPEAGRRRRPQARAVYIPPSAGRQPSSRLRVAGRIVRQDRAPESRGKLETSRVRPRFAPLLIQRLPDRGFRIDGGGRHLAVLPSTGGHVVHGSGYGADLLLVPVPADAGAGFSLRTASPSGEREIGRSSRLAGAGDTTVGVSIVLEDGRLFRVVPVLRARGSRVELAGWEGPGAYWRSRPARARFRIEPTVAGRCLEASDGLLILFTAELLEAFEE